MPKFLSDLEVQGKINAASATINDLMVGKLEVSGGGDLCVDSITVEKDSAFKGSATFSSYATFSYNPLFEEGFCITEDFTLRESGGLLVEKNGCSFEFVFFPDEDETTATVRGNFCVTDILTVRGTACVAGLGVECTACVGELYVGGPANFSCGANFCGDVCTCTLLADSALVYCLNAVPLCGNTALGADAYGLSVSRDGGLQLWGTHFLQGSVWSDDTLKIVHNDLSLGATDKAFLGFDYANEVNFRTFPNDGTEATYCFVANQWENDSHEYYKPAGVRLKKANQVSEISDEDVLNVGEGDQRWVPTNLACRSVDIITNACLQDPACSYGVRLGGNGSDVPIWVRGDACVAGWLTIEPRFGCSSSSAQGVISAQWSQFRVDTSNDFCICAQSFSFTPLNSQGGIEAISISGSGALFKTCTTFDKDIYTKEKVYLTNLPTYSGSSDPENTSLITKSYLDSRLTSVYSFKGTKAKKSDLNSVTTKAKGDVYNVTEDGMNYAWDGTAWDALGGDFSRYYTKTEVDTKLGDYYTKTSANSTFAKTSGGNYFSGAQYFLSTTSFCTNVGIYLNNGINTADLFVENDTDKPQLSFRSGETEVILDVSRPGTLAVEEEVYDRATIDGVTTGANVLPKMNEVIGYLEDYEEKTGEKLPLELYEETVKAIEEWQKDPTAEKRWETNTNSSTWESVSTCPYRDVPATSPIVDLSVTYLSANIASYPVFNSKTDVVVFLPKANRTNCCFCYSSFNKPFIAPNSLYWRYFARGSSKYNMHTLMPSASEANEAFAFTGMSAENISKTLDSLPEHTDGKEHVITFTGSPGAAELNQDSPSVAAAVAKGWTVEL